MGAEPTGPRDEKIRKTSTCMHGNSACKLRSHPLSSLVPLALPTVRAHTGVKLDCGVCVASWTLDRDARDARAGRECKWGEDGGYFKLFAGAAAEPERRREGCVISVISQGTRSDTASFYAKLLVALRSRVPG